MTLWIRFWRSRLPEIFAIVWLVWSVGRLGMVLPGRALNFDFNHYYTSSWLARHGESPYRADLIAVSRQLGFSPTETIPHATNPPSLLWLVAPLTFLPPRAAFAVWTLVMIVEWVALVWLTLDLLRERLTMRGRIFCLAYFGSAMSVYCNFYFGHIELLLALLVLGAYRCLVHGRGGWAVALVAIASLLKLFPLALLPWFVWCGAADLKTRLRYVVLAAAIGGLGVLATGIGLWREFWQTGVAVVSEIAVNYSFNFSLTSFGGKLFLVLKKWLGADWPWAWATTLAWALGGLVLTGAYGLCWRTRRGREAEFCLLSVAMLLAGLTAWGFYFVFLLFPVVVLAERLSVNGTRRQRLWYALAVLVMELMETQSGPALDRYYLVKVLVNYLPLYGAVILGLLFSAAQWRLPGPVASRGKVGIQQPQGQ